ncbi:helix-turn-helix domain-containing protein [Enterococcus sp. JM9B]|uniref:helix-turn-helix domain-containing protein n=1 Tax=Enterococcus sp. JM9B TaxID=1857216 RepID=UPI001374B484|nr:helix-turn-helix domain-containing protein [Enterococcus sp. JM9B]KAF1304680.1 transcriptional regulator [Enterococcus sp. JM9B]
MQSNNDELIQMGNLLKKVRLSKMLTQEELAKLSNISQATIVKYENGLRSISKKSDKVLSEVLGVDSFIKHLDEKNWQILIDLKKYQCINNFSREELSKQLDIEISLLNKFLNKSRPLSKNAVQKITQLLTNDGKEILMDIKQDDGSFKLPIVDKIAMGGRIQEIRKNRGESLEKFGKNFTRPAGKNVVTRWEKGINIPDIERLMNVAYLGKVTVPYLLYGDTFSKMLKNGNKVSKFEKLDPFRMGLRLRKIRRDYRLEREDFGKFFSPPITKWSMDRYENGKDIPNTDRIIQYAYIGKVSLEFLIYGI